MRHFLTLLQDRISNDWDKPALTDYGRETFTNEQVARQIEKFHILFEEAGLQKGDKVVISGRNSSRWAMSFLAISTYGCVAVPILADFTPENIEGLVRHCDARALFIDINIWGNMSGKAAEGLCVVFSLANYQVIHSSKESTKELSERIDEAFDERFPSFSPSDINYDRGEDSFDDICVINYTSGTTGNPKGIMLTAGNISANIDFSLANIHCPKDSNSLSMLPLAHMFGLTIEFLYTYVGGANLHFLGKTPSPGFLMKALADIKPYILVTVPLVMEKIVRGKIMPLLEKPSLHFFSKVPIVSSFIFASIHKGLMRALGGKVENITIGGAAISHEVEKILKKAHIPYTIGYGMTECGPLIGYVDWRDYKIGSCGRIVDGMQIRVVKESPDEQIGELQVKGRHVMKGYYKDENASAEAFSKDGWLRTGDLGLIDKEGNIYIKGRCKCMILSSNGQNIYPEEIELQLNNLPFVSESLVVSRNKNLVALVSPDYEQIKLEGEGKSAEVLMEKVLTDINKLLPAYSRISKIEILPDGFVHTPKHSIKRNIYS